jgi:low temperature requirement protein LtrA
MRRTRSTATPTALPGRTSPCRERSWLFTWARLTLPATRGLANRYLLGFGVCAALFAVSTAVSEPANYYLWLAALAIAISTPFLSVRVIQRTPIHAAHIPERFGLFTIIVLGETILSIAVGTEATGWGTKGALAGVFGLLCAGCLWLVTSISSMARGR